MLRHDRERAGQDVVGVELDSPDFVALANAFGVEAERVDGVGRALGDVLARHLANDKPSLVVTEVSLMLPPTTSPRWYRHAVAMSAWHHTAKLPSPLPGGPRGLLARAVRCRESLGADRLRSGSTRAGES
jgi:hypothetical protein